VGEEASARRQRRAGSTSPGLQRRTAEGGARSPTVTAVAGAARRRSGRWHTFPRVGDGGGWSLGSDTGYGYE